jgi:hypothetical protein
MLDYFFGLGDGTTKLVNEPTIDYNTPDNHFKSTTTNGYCGTYSSQQDFTTTSVKSLPSDYPGKFTKPSVDYTPFESVRTNNSSSVPSLSSAYIKNTHQLNSTINDNLNKYLSNEYSYKGDYQKQPGGSYNPIKTYDTTTNNTRYPPPDSTTVSHHVLTTKINNLKHTSTYSSTKPRQLQFDLLIDQVETNNRFLKKVDQLVDSNGNYSEPENALAEKFENLKQTYINDAKNWEAFTENYIELDRKYRELKSKTVSKTLVSFKENINRIKHLSSDSNVKFICDSLLTECDTLNDKDEVIRSYEQQLLEAKERIKQLELKIK